MRRESVSGIDGIYSGLPKYPKYPILLYVALLLVCWGAAGQIVISGLFVAASPGTEFSRTFMALFIGPLTINWLRIKKLICLNFIVREGNLLT